MRTAPADLMNSIYMSRTGPSKWLLSRPELVDCDYFSTHLWLVHDRYLYVLLDMFDNRSLVAVSRFTWVDLGNCISEYEHKHIP